MALYFIGAGQLEEVGKGNSVDQVVHVEVDIGQAFTDLGRVAVPLSLLPIEPFDRIFIDRGEDTLPLIALGVHHHWRPEHDGVDEVNVTELVVAFWNWPVVSLNEH